MGHRRGRSEKRLESQLGRRSPKKIPSKFMSTSIWGDWPYCCPAPGRGIRPYVKRARRKETREAWRIERLNGEDP
jgi:hypothetical protein